MPIPLNLLRWAGTWDVNAVYSTYDVVFDSSVPVQNPPLDTNFVYIGTSGTNTNLPPSGNVFNPPIVWIPYPATMGTPGPQGPAGPAGPQGPQGAAGGTFGSSYGEFISTTTQPLPAATSTTLTFSAKNSGTADVVPVGLSFPTSGVQINTAGTYRAIFSVQINKSAGGMGSFAEFQFYFLLNGNPVANTNSQTQTTKEVDLIMTIESFFTLSGGDRIGVAGYVPAGSANCEIYAQGVDANHPVGIPSILLNIQRIA